MTIDIDIAVESDGWAALGDLDPLLREAVDAAQAEADVDLADHAEVSFLLCDDARIRELNRDWRGFDKPTNVLSFPAAEPEDLAQAPLLGDIAIAFETVQREAVEEGKPLRDHVAHMVVHGFLHLVGYDHENNEEAEEMEAAERRALQRLGVSDPYAATVPVRDEP